MFELATLLAAEGEEMPSVLAVPLDELIIGLIAFLLVFGTLAKFVLPKIKVTLDERANLIEGGLERAGKAEEEAASVLLEYQKQLAGAREEASAIRTAAQADRAAIVDEARNEARVAAASVTTAAEAAMAAERAQAVSALTRQVGELALDLADKVVGEALANDARVSSTVDAFIADLEKVASK
ncbi:MAG: F0F1 ATP synthase subunit B [Candidatus Nanopelagicales bacterium]|jgi:F-type H+-transporting ATPase subunit b|nr:F0F1 ATP synthase subunit B [Actinomycetes bacterium]MCH9830443.1 F0F1 ATP synthase subunit B [Actinomycetes bacterium]MCH9840821.1 F0F1 ATP synthase subunit B [Actinomycetes bacterium]